MTFHLDWTDAQWDEWYRRRVTIDLDFLDSLANAVDLIVKGAHLNVAERANWKTTLKTCHALIQRESDKVDAMVPDA